MQPFTAKSARPRSDSARSDSAAPCGAPGAPAAPDQGSAEATSTPTINPTETATATAATTATATGTATATSIPAITPTGPPTATATFTPTATATPQAAACALYPITLHTSTVAGAQPGIPLGRLYSGTGADNFGWLTWTGDSSASSLVVSLTPPGDSHTYLNPNDPSGRTVSLGDWIRRRSNVSNNRAIRDAVDQLMAQDILVPVWDQVTGNGNNVRHRTSAFAQIRITAYNLTQNYIEATYIGAVTCAP